MSFPQKVLKKDIGYWSQYVLVNSKSYFSWKFGIQYDEITLIVFF